MENFICTMGGVPREAIKIKTYECYTKIQEVYPNHRSNLVNK